MLPAVAALAVVALFFLWWRVWLLRRCVWGGWGERWGGGELSFGGEFKGDLESEFLLQLLV